MADKMFNYPFLPGWSTDDIIKVSRLYTLVSDAYEKNVNREQLLAAYDDFKTVVPSKSEEKQLDRSFGQVSDYSIYRTVQTARNLTYKTFKMEP